MREVFSKVRARVEAGRECHAARSFTRVVEGASLSWARALLGHTPPGRHHGLKSSAERFNYLYSTAELEALVPPIRALSERVEELHVLFNNCYEDKAQRNALELVQLLGSP